ncbi:hypothetical protein J8L70_02960 [Pseudoalteromonas sp. MMG010]|uniref:hypothetical protein n=1 Tax=Pseudoalteromonas sp. MMG010 TaxID=2822685 RepID=UPI001B3A5585|nr:hypothetical protein [Pseudoalteromonas sp. MMG010]MBQ4832191.1 hypothetical protein [Pseudoalteromonas sp. MMG010]
MDELKNDFNKLLNDSPIDNANRVQSKEHIELIVAEDVKEAQTGHINTDKNTLSFRIKDATISAIKDRLGRWISERNDAVLRAKAKHSESSASGVDQKSRELHQEAEDAKAKARDQFMQKNHYSDKRREYEQTKQRYENMQAEMGGKPPVPKRMVLYVISILVIGFVEWFINYSTFNIKYPPGLAAGATMIVALSIAFASHFHGALIKQRVALFAPHRTDTEKRHVLIYQSFFSLLLVFALIVVTYNRYDVLSEQLVNSAGAMLPSLPGDTADSASSVWEELMPFIVMNLLVWIVGVAVSFFIHDARPDYQEAKNDYEKAKKDFFSVDNGLKKEVERIEAEFKEKLTGVKNKQSSASAISKEIVSYLERLLKKEEALLTQALSAINDDVHRHQSLLVTEIKKQNLEGVVIGPEQLSVDQFLKMDLKLTMNELRQNLALEPIQ